MKNEKRKSRYFKKIIFFFSFNLIALFFIVIFLEIFLYIFFDGIIRKDGSYLKKHDVFGAVNKNNVLINQKGPEFEFIIETNSQGFREQEDIKNKNPLGLKRVMFFGDSFIFGAGVNYHQTISSLFDSISFTNGYQIDVINCGISSFNTTSSVLYMENIIENYFPDIVVLSIMPNDIFHNLPIESSMDIHNEIIRKSEKKDNHNKNNITQNNLIRTHEFKFQLPILAKRILLSSDYIYSKIYSNTNRGEFFNKNIVDHVQNKLNITYDLIDRIKLFCKEKGVKLILLYIPQQFEVLYESQEYFFDNINSNIILENIASYADEGNIHFTDPKKKLIQVYKRNKQHLYFRMDGHLNYFGNKIVAESIFQSNVLNSL